MTKALRNDEGKPEMHYLHTWYDALAEVCQVCSQGALKYERGNYLRGQSLAQLLNCAERHIGKFGSPYYPDWDEESGRHHLAHAIWNLLQALQQHINSRGGPGYVDDRVVMPGSDEKA